jgi:hypothetical protein
MIFARRRVRHDRVGNATVGYLILARFHRHGCHRRHRLNARDIDLGKPLDESQHSIELAAKVLDLLVGDSDPRKMRDPADSIGVNGHAKLRRFESGWPWL